MVELILALLISCGLALVCKRLVSNAFPEKIVNAALIGAIVTVLLFFMAANWLGYKHAILAGAAVVLVAAGMALRLIWKERQLAMIEGSEQVTFEFQAEEEVVLQEGSSAEHNTLPASSVEEALVTATVPVLAETAAALEEFPEVGHLADEHEWKERTPELTEPVGLPAEKDFPEELFSSLPSETTVEQFIDPENDNEDDLLLSDLSTLLDEVVPHEKEPVTSTDLRKPVLQMEEWFGEERSDESQLPSSTQLRSSALFELEEIEVREDGTKKWTDS